MAAWAMWPLAVTGYLLAAGLASTRRRCPGFGWAAALTCGATTAFVLLELLEFPWQVRMAFDVYVVGAALTAGQIARTARRRARRAVLCPPPWPANIPPPRLPVSTRPLRLHRVRVPVPPPPRNEGMPWWTTYN